MAQLRRLRQLFPHELVIIGVHSAKFPAEKLTENIRAAVMRHDIEHPVVNDQDFEIWNQYGVRAWPTVVLIDPKGKVVAYQSGEIDADEVRQAVEAIKVGLGAEDALDHAALNLVPETAHERTHMLRYPSKLLATSPMTTAQNLLYIADSGHHRILEVELSDDNFSAPILRTFGSGKPGLRDGAIRQAQFYDPHGMAIFGSTLYVADTGNHAIRAIDLRDGSVRTVAGTGEKGRGLATQMAKPTETPLRSPWALSAIDDVLLIAMTGSHQIWLLVKEETLGIFAGNGAEALVDGPRLEASFNQPSDLVLDMGHLFVADAEASAVRAISLESDPQVFTLVGQGLFAFGDVDGEGADVRLQHPTGLTSHNGLIYVADSYNHKIKLLDPTTGRTQTLIGSGQPGHLDGPFATAQLYEPEGVVELEGRLYIADTNNHAIRVADLEVREIQTLEIS